MAPHNSFDYHDSYCNDALSIFKKGVNSLISNVSVDLLSKNFKYNLTYTLFGIKRC